MALYRVVMSSSKRRRLLIAYHPYEAYVRKLIQCVLQYLYLYPWINTSKVKFKGNLMFHGTRYRKTVTENINITPLPEIADRRITQSCSLNFQHL
jgi:hypothetical protein